MVVTFDIAARESAALMLLIQGKPIFEVRDCLVTLF